MSQLNQLVTLDGLNDFAKRVPVLGNPNNIAPKNGLALGDYNAPVDDAVLLIGNGTGVEDAQRSNALIATKDKITINIPTEVSTIKPARIETNGDESYLLLAPGADGYVINIYGGQDLTKKKPLRLNFPQATDKELCTGTQMRLGHISLFGAGSTALMESAIPFDKYKDLQQTEYISGRISYPPETTTVLTPNQSISGTTTFEVSMPSGIWDLWLRNSDGKWENMFPNIFICPPYSMSQDFLSMDGSRLLRITEKFMSVNATYEISVYTNAEGQLSIQVHYTFINPGTLNATISQKHFQFHFVARIAFP